MAEPYPTRVLAGVTVPDTPLITKAIALARAHISDFAFNHVMRSWLFGQFISNSLPFLQPHDAELHAISAILHDMGWAKSGDFVSKDKRFEVDGANAVRAFLTSETDWDAHKIQTAWDSVALHTTPSIAVHKQAEVACCAIGIGADFQGPERAFGGVLTKEVWDEITREFPRLGFRQGIKGVLCGLCREKPETTYDNFVSEFGVAYVEGYSLEGKSFVDLVNVAQD